MLTKTRLGQAFWAMINSVCLGAVLCFAAAPAMAQQKTDFLKAEGAPVSVARFLENGLRKHVASQKQFKLIPNPMAPGMAQLTLGCTLDSAGCVARLAKMRSAKVVFHLRVLPFGSRAKAVFRKLDGATGKVLKSVSYRFRRRKLKKALATLKSKMFGGGTPAARPAPTVVARRAVPAPRRAVPVARRAPAVVRRAAPPVRRASAVVARRAAPVARRAAPVARRAPAVVARRAAPVARRAPAVVRRAAPVARRAPAVVARRAAPVARPIARATVTPTPRRGATLNPKARPVPRLRELPPTLGTPKTPARRVAKVKVKPKPAPKVALWKRPSFWAWICVGVTVAAVGGTIAFGLDAQSKEGEIKQLIERSKQGENISYKTNVQPLEDSGKTSAVMANVFIGIGAATAATAVVLFLLPKPKPTAPKTSLQNTKSPTPLANTPIHLQVQ